MRTEAIWDKWMQCDEDGFYDGLKPDAPDEVKEAYAKFLADQEAAMKAGPIQK